MDVFRNHRPWFLDKHQLGAYRGRGVLPLLLTNLVIHEL
jgi:hypothetical protein